jgi:hypothetical protein
MSISFFRLSVENRQGGGACDRCHTTSIPVLNDTLTLDYHLINQVGKYTRETFVYSFECLLEKRNNQQSIIMTNVVVQHPSNPAHIFKRVLFTVCPGAALLMQDLQLHHVHE